MLNFTAVAPGVVKPCDYAGIKHHRPDKGGEHVEYVRIRVKIRDSM
jgi:hypothetical protein